MADTPQFRVAVRTRCKPEGMYTFRITKSDDPAWFEESGNSYTTSEAALKAGYERLKQLNRDR